MDENPVADDFEAEESVDFVAYELDENLSDKARALAIRRKIEDSLEEKRMREEFGF